MGIGWPDHFIEHGSSIEKVRLKYGLTPTDIVEQVRALLEFPKSEKISFDMKSVWGKGIPRLILIVKSRG